VGGWEEGDLIVQTGGFVVVPKFNYLNSGLNIWILAPRIWVLAPYIWVLAPCNWVLAPKIVHRVFSKGVRGGGWVPKDLQEVSSSVSGKNIPPTPCVHEHKHTHCTYGVLGCEPRGRDETPGGPEESRWTKSQNTCICIWVQSTHVHVYAESRMRSWNNCFFSLIYFFFRQKKAKDVNTNHR